MSGIPFSFSDISTVAGLTTPYYPVIIGPDTDNVLMIDSIRFSAALVNSEFPGASVTIEIGIGSNYGGGNDDVSNMVFAKNSWNVETPAVKAYKGYNPVTSGVPKEFATLYLNGSDEYIWFSNCVADDIKLTTNRTLYIVASHGTLEYSGHDIKLITTIEGEI